MRDPRPFLRTPPPLVNVADLHPANTGTSRTDVAMSRTSRPDDDPLLKAIRVGLGNAHDAGEHHKDDLTADHIAVVLDDYGMVVPVGVTIGLVYRTVRRSGPDGYQFTDRRVAFDHAQFGGTDGRWRHIRPDDGPIVTRP